jgi:hypothetical protein
MPKAVELTVGALGFLRAARVRFLYLPPARFAHSALGAVYGDAERHDRPTVRAEGLLALPLGPSRFVGDCFSRNT